MKTVWTSEWPSNQVTFVEFYYFIQVFVEVFKLTIFYEILLLIITFITHSFIFKFIIIIIIIIWKWLHNASNYCITGLTRQESESSMMPMSSSGEKSPIFKVFSSTACWKDSTLCLARLQLIPASIFGSIISMADMPSTKLKLVIFCVFFVLISDF